MKARTGSGIACALGVLGGVLIGGRAVKTYDWRTEWTIPAPMPVVYKAMTSRGAVREWCPDMDVVEDNADDDLKVGSTVSFLAHQAPEVARLAPPFRIHCLYTDVESERRLRDGEWRPDRRAGGPVPRAGRRHPHNFQLVRARHQPSPQPPGICGRRHLPCQSRQRDEVGREGALGVLPASNEFWRFYQLTL
jgi:hypothetical protein